MAIILTYFLGCSWYAISKWNYHDDEVTFVNRYKLDDFDSSRRLIICCYFALTTLSTVGYGDLTPSNNLEKVVGIIIMILGIAFFSFIMGNFNDVLINYDKKMGI